MTCNICFNNDSDRLYVKELMFGTGRQYEYYKCNVCGTLELSKLENDIEFLYPSNYYSLQQGKKNILQKIFYLYHNLLFFVTFYSIKYLKINPFNYNNYGISRLARIVSKDSKILDIGCGRGDFLSKLSFLGFKNLYGVDPYISEKQNNLEFNLIKTEIFNYNPNFKFDFIYLNHSFEHMSSPYEVMEKVSSLLTDDGYCFLRIPVADSYAFKLYKSNWFQIDAPRHLFLHTRVGIKNILSKNKLEIFSEIDDSTFMQFFASEQYQLGNTLFSKKFRYQLILQKYLYIFSFSRIYSRLKYLKMLKKVKLEMSGDQKTFIIKKIKNGIS